MKIANLNINEINMTTNITKLLNKFEIRIKQVENTKFTLLNNAKYTALHLIMLM